MVGTGEVLAMQQWEYRVVHLNLDNRAVPQPADPQVASDKLHGALSPEYIAREFPAQYKNAPPPKHPVEQLQYFLNLLGKEGWEMVQTHPVGPLLMVFFKRPLRPPPARLAAGQARATLAPAQPAGDAPTTAAGTAAAEGSDPRTTDPGERNPGPKAQGEPEAGSGHPGALDGPMTPGH